MHASIEFDNEKIQELVSRAEELCLQLERIAHELWHAISCDVSVSSKIDGETPAE